MAGILFEKDELILRWSVDEVLLRRKRTGKTELNFLECGCAAADTSRVVIRYINRQPYRKEFRLKYYGIDSLDLLKQPPIVHQMSFKFVKGYTFEVADQIPKSLDWIFIDACHCAMCVQRDTEIYAPRLSEIGLLAYHDASPLFQGYHPQTYGNLKDVHDPHAAEQGVQVLKGIENAKVESYLRLVKAALPQKDGGVQIYTRIEDIKVI